MINDLLKKQTLQMFAENPNTEIQIYPGINAKINANN